MDEQIKVGDRVQFTYHWWSIEDEEQLEGTVIEIVAALGRTYAWISVRGTQSPLFVRLDKIAFVTVDTKATADR